jgi:predicted nucleotidyltransferase
MTEILAGRVVNYYKAIGVASVEVSDCLKVGDLIHIVGHITDFEQKIESMEINHKKVSVATKGQRVGIKVKEYVRKKDLVYRVDGPIMNQYNTPLHSEKEALISKAREALKTWKHIVFAYIFGSFVTEEQFNDIDIGVFLSDSGTIPLLTQELKMERQISDILGFTVDVRIINNAPLTFIYNILKSRIVLIDRDSSFRADFEGLICKKYFDFQYLRREYLREIINAPF